VPVHENHTVHHYQIEAISTVLCYTTHGAPPSSSSPRALHSTYQKTQSACTGACVARLEADRLLRTQAEAAASVTASSEGLRHDGSIALTPPPRKMNESPSRLSRRLRTILHRVHTLICWVASRQQRTDYVRTQRPRAPVCRRRPRGQTGSTQGDRGIQDARSDGWVFTALQQLFFCHCEPKVKGGEDCCLCFCDVLATLLQYKPR
jgi:hypothetical protein